MIKFSVGVPTLNRADLLHESMASHNHLMPNIPYLIIDNGNQDIDIDYNNIAVMNPGENIGVAASWNCLCNLIFKTKDYALILNDDVVLGRTENDMAMFIGKHPNYDIFVSLNGFCSFILTKKAWEVIGKFDENFFPAYFEDNDYMRRIALAGLHVLHTPFLTPMIFRKSMTLEKDRTTVLRFEICQNYYVRKWGGMPEKEIYDLPFDGKPRS